ncbi:MAG: dephospho-CoA kinase [Treponemataceae bacterium]
MKTKIIAITGPMAAGKNYICSIFEKMGCVSIDADKLAHTAVEISKNSILEAFNIEAQKKGIQILNEKGNINRRELARIVFDNEENLKIQESIIHPVVNNMMEAFIKNNKGRLIILNGAVLYKTPIIKTCDAIIFVTAPCFIRFLRARKRDKMKLTAILQRFKAQKNLFAKYYFLNADVYKVRNLGSLRKLEKKLHGILTDIGYEGN